MYSQAVEDQHISGANRATDPIVTSSVINRDLRNVEILPLVLLNTETMRAFQDPQWSHVDRTIMERDPYREELGISPHEFVILVSVDHEAITVGKYQPSNRLGMNEDLVTDQHLHHICQCRLMRQRVKRFEVEDLLIDAFEDGIRIAEGRPWPRNALQGVGFRRKPTLGRKDTGYISQHGLDGMSWQEFTNQHVTFRIDLLLQLARPEIACMKFMESFHSKSPLPRRDLIAGL